ncbi:MAG TPA: iron-containing alcohol dehydrogenase [bacterium]|uniref:1,3-propanediol dehydrogenase n=1 Tax=candidate division TA06 bacterium ADurb.Bin417 TaxID=1852828 RepID=A0A1V5MGE7_UNCT6|nr:MAG: 1,3-propanediol dehydrogenase [candidate division TA06 bacterium ADurb.Bin417]HNQ35707.1 iron-containing alcohol dehydrogenase [bacterium]HNS48847.1 iron-containing alcohol dehydrogenase [bacterium]
MSSRFYWYLPTEVFFGVSALDVLSEKAAGLGRKALLVTGRSFAAKSGLRTRIEERLKAAGVAWAVFDGAIPDPEIGTVAAGAEVCRRENCNFVIGAGGGSAMDVAKGIAAAAPDPARPIEELFGYEQLRVRPLPVAAVPTTSGSGSEVTRYAVIVDPAARTKKTISSASINPRLALVQPELTLTLPADLTAETGLDAFCHAVEGSLAAARTPVSLALAREAVRLITRHLPELVRRPDDLAGREGMSLAALTAGMVINQTGTIIGHGMGYPLTINYGIQHGLASVMAMPAILDELIVTDEYGPVIREVTGWTEPGRQLRDFCGRLGRPASLKAAGIGRSDLPKLAAEAVVGCQRAMQNMGRNFTEADFLRFYESVYD